MRKCGVFINISSLPSAYGIGGLGSEIGRAARVFSGSGIKIWQILPITAIGQGNSPYSSESAFAGNYLYIDPVMLADSGLLSRAACDAATYNGSPYTVDYDVVKAIKKGIILACQTEDNYDHEDLAKFVEKNKHWLSDYAAYMAIKASHGGAEWWNWEPKLASYDSIAVADYVNHNSAAVEYYYLEQYLFDMQWRAARATINSLGIEVMGDMPIYVSRDSVDVWANRGIFQLNEDYNPSHVAGVPPDYFSELGQLWGNPLYDYVAMASDGYAWFKGRMARMFELYDICRFDHFRAVSEYWAVKYGMPDARQGEWLAGGGIEMMNAIMSASSGEIVAEDLGIIGDNVIKLRKDCNLKGMRIMQFGYDGDDSLHAIHNYERDIVAYSGTHDNNTLFGWLYELNSDKRKNLLDYVGAAKGLSGGKDSPQVWGCIRAILTSVADYAIFPYQDLAGWGGDTRLNVPGVPEGNWRVRITEDAYNQVDWARLSNLIALSFRK